ncbi:MAG: sigma-54-dependent Fis family transcriptional regulator, partial [candidate division WOR-3 bacterium]
MRKPKVRVLVVDDDEKIRLALSDILREQDYEVVEASDGTEALERLRSDNISMMLLDYQLPDFDGLKVLAEVRKTHADLPVVMVSGFGTIRLAVEATKKGAYDFLEKPLNAERITVTVRNALEKYLLRQEVAELRRQTLSQYEMVGNSAPMQRVYEIIDRAAPSRANVLILGESGVGKELVARAIHRKSLAADGPFVR